MVVFSYLSTAAISPLHKAQTGQYCVKNRLKMLMYWRVHCAFSSILALSCALKEMPLGRTRLSLLQYAA